MSERERSLTVQCHHAGCSDIRWLRYCPIEGSNPDGGVSALLNQLDYLLCNSSVFEKNKYFYEGNNQEQSISRIFTQYHMQEDLVQVVGYRSDTAIYYGRLSNPRREIYRVISEWTMSDEDTVSDGFRTEYCIEQYPELIHATVTEYNISTSAMKYENTDQTYQRVDRPMTSYDQQQLAMLLSNIENTNLSEANDYY